MLCNWHLHLLQQQRQARRLYLCSASPSHHHVSVSHAATLEMIYFITRPRTSHPTRTANSLRGCELSVEFAANENEAGAITKLLGYRYDVMPPSHAVRFVIPLPTLSLSSSLSLCLYCCLCLCHWRPIDGYKLCVLIFIRFDVVNKSPKRGLRLRLRLPACQGRIHEKKHLPDKSIEAG